MMTLLRALHSIAALRGDGLRPEFLQMTLNHRHGQRSRR